MMDFSRNKALSGMVRQAHRWHRIPGYSDIGSSVEPDPVMSLFSGRTTRVLGVAWKKLAGSSSSRH